MQLSGSIIFITSSAVSLIGHKNRHKQANYFLVVPGVGLRCFLEMRWPNVTEVLEEY